MTATKMSFTPRPADVLPLVTPARRMLQAMGCQQLVIQTWSVPLAEGLVLIEANTAPRQALFATELGHECMRFTALVEKLNYSDAKRIWQTFARFDVDKDREPDEAELAMCRTLVGKPKALAIAAYGGRMGNKPAPSEDGWFYRGRGPIMCTGYDNHREFEEESGIPVTSNPDLLLNPSVGMAFATFYWRKRRISRHADVLNLRESRKAINGGTNGLKDTTELYPVLLKAAKAAAA